MEHSAHARDSDAPNESEAMLRSFNDTPSEYPQSRLIHELFEAQVRRTPLALAVVHGVESLTYLQLNEAADRLALHLRARGIQADSLVGLCFERSTEMVVALLGVLKAGGAYLPIDPGYPLDRVRQMLQDARPPVILTQEALRSVVSTGDSDIVSLASLWSTSPDTATHALPVAANPIRSGNLVYVIYTSGSTGRPKGIAMGHREMVNLLEWHKNHLPLRNGERVLQFAALSFDVAFQETFTTLCAGGTLVLLDDWIRRDAQALAEFLVENRIQRLFTPPLMLQYLADALIRSRRLPLELRDVIAAGEQLRITPAMTELFSSLPECRLHNHYGPTETHVVTALTLASPAASWPALPNIGRPIANIQIHILDDELAEAPVGIAGEIYIGGAGVARGYFGRPELTAERFLTLERFGRVYKTGDLGRWNPDGTLEYFGRNDDQIKIRGFRVELSEIESHLRRHEHVKEAAVVARTNARGEKHLVAYVVPQASFNSGSSSTRVVPNPFGSVLRSFLTRSLPDYMVPASFVLLESFPLTPNGKLDRRALPAPERSGETHAYQEPEGDMERALSEIWQEVLCVQRVGRHDNFFELGGNSILSMKLVAEVSDRLGLRLSTFALFENPTIAQIASHVLPPDDHNTPPPQSGSEHEEFVL